MELNYNIPLLIDFDGVIRICQRVAIDAEEFFKFISDKKIPACILSNSTLRNGYDIKKFFVDNNIKTEIPALTCADASLNFVKVFSKNLSAISVPPSL
jgi:ribonucleotide monophosphatase NagD (HAD superfamily)